VCGSWDALFVGSVGMRDRLSQHTALRGRAVARIAVALLGVLGGGALVSDAAAGSSSGPVPYSSLHLDQPGATFSVPSWTTSSNGCTIGEPNTQQSFNAALSSGTGGTGLLTLGFAGGSLSSPVSSTGPSELHFDLKGSSNNGAGTYDLNLTGYGTTFTGSAQLSDPSCTYTSSSATLTLAGGGLTLTGVDVALALNPDTVSVCSSSCSSVLATATVTNSSSGRPVAGQSVSFSSSDPNVKIGPVTDHGDGTYTASLEPSEDPGDVMITASDDSVTPAATGTATLYQVCTPDNASAGARVGLLASTPDTRHCTTTTVHCPRATVNGFNACLIVVKDTAAHPVRPTGKVDMSIWQPTIWPAGTAKNPRLYQRVSCTLQASPAGGSRTAVCLMKILLWDPRKTPVVAQVIGTSYFGDAKHRNSAAPPGPSISVYVPGADAKALEKAYLDDQGNVLLVETLGFKAVKVAATYVGAATTVPAPPVAATAKMIETAFGAVSDGTAVWAGWDKYEESHLKDPPDQLYRSVPRPRLVRQPQIAGPPLIRDAEAFLANARNFGAIAVVLPKAVNRAITAARAKHYADAGRQIVAASEFYTQLVSIVKQDISLRRDLARLVRSIHLRPSGRDASAVHKLQGQLDKAARALTNKKVIGGEELATKWLSALAQDPVPAVIG
jgi:hypothetical protein